MIAVLAAALLAGPARAASCCASAGVAPTALASCDRLGLGLGVGGDLQTGGWAWDGRWSAVGDDGGGEGTLSAALLARVSPWLQLGARAPLRLSVDALDGARSAELGLGRASAWLLVEAPPDRLGERAPQLAGELGLAGGSFGSEDHDQSSLAAQLGLRVATAPAPWGLWGRLALEQPLVGEAARALDGSLTLDRQLGGRARLGLALIGHGEGGAFPTLETSLGPSLTLAPTISDRVQLTALLGPPVPGAGRNATSHLLLSVEWVNVIRPFPTAP